MKLISESNEVLVLSLVGGKGLHLQKLVEWSAPVADFFVITTESFNYFQIHKKIPSEVNERIERFLKSHKKMAMRSSMISEDQADASFAGLFETLLDVTQENWQDSLVQIFSSVNSPRVQEYIEKKKMTVDLKMAVVVQELIEVQKSGVIFTRSPITPTSAMVIDAGLGLGEGVVSGLVDVDQYQYTRSLDLIGMTRSHDQNVLDEGECKKLLKLALVLEDKLGQPSDIEWGIRDGKIYIFQIRPITQSFRPLKYFVDTNLSESYPGTVSPFTAEFVKKAYENVFTESATIMGAKGNKLKVLQSHYANLICSIDNHLYYNLEHYYAALRALPGGEKNIEKWHKMIGGNMDDQKIPFHATAPNFVETLKTASSLITLAKNKKKIFGKFLSDLDVMKIEIEQELECLNSSHEIIIFINKLVNKPCGFGLTVINDIFIMLGLGHLSKVLKHKGLEESEVIDLLKTNEGIDSVKPLLHFNQMIQTLSEDFISALKEKPLGLGVDPYQKIFKELTSEGWGKEVERLKDFIDTYGDRSFEELKLESLPMKNNSVLLRDLIGWGQKHQVEREIIHRDNKELKLGILDSKIKAFTQDSIATREAARLWRGKFYHLLRKAVLKLSERLSKEDSSWSDFQILDYFSVTHLEWLAFIDKKITVSGVQVLMTTRRNWQTKVKYYPEIIPWVEGEELPDLTKLGCLQNLSGQGVSPGKAEGVALVLENPTDAFHSDLENFILVTKNTDPAWVYIMSRSSGLISEKGSLLSHTAIIGRELGVPTIVGVKGITHSLRTGDRIRIDADKGIIEKL